MELIVSEDEHLLVANKPAGWNTHSPAPFAGEGLYEWLRLREPRWQGLSLLHRLDKETSGLIVFGKTTVANRALARQFEEGRVLKKYLFLTDRPATFRELKSRCALVRSGAKYVSRPIHAGAAVAETVFQPVGDMIEARPLTGKTHQIRVQAAAEGFPILGDTVYGGAPFPRLCLHAAELQFKHPVTGQTVSFSVPPNFTRDTRLALRQTIIDSSETDAFRLAHGAADGWPGLYVDKLGEYLLAQSPAPPTARERSHLENLAQRVSARGIYHKILQREGRAAPVLLWGVAAPEEISVRENGLCFALRLDEGYSAGLFLDQRDNRRRFLTRFVAPSVEIPPRAEVLNTFAYTCGFSVCAAVGGARVTSVDLSKNYLEWGSRNFSLNGLDPSGHEFLHGDVFDWLRRFVKKKRLFDVVVLDPPTFSRSRESGVFQAEKDYGALVAAALPALKPGGVLFASANAAGLAPGDFLDALTGAITRAGRLATTLHYAPQPPDFPIERAEPAYLKTVWVRVS
jgi:23S rRNA (cytosine1962-C5)-methyltransferase